jgi:hypothetical protein
VTSSIGRPPRKAHHANIAAVILSATDVSEQSAGARDVQAGAAHSACALEIRYQVDLGGCWTAAMFFRQS